jgi:nucleoside-diphosphate-sugar epimerase
MRILFIGGTGVISSACSQLAIDEGHDLTLLNRGNAPSTLSGSYEKITGDINDAAIAATLSSREFDVVVDWICFDENDAKRDIRLFHERTSQFIFISSASVYETPPSFYPITENAALSNPYWEYSRNKIRCEQVLMEACETNGLPLTIVRPSHTYGNTMIPLPGRYTVVDRMLKGKEVIIHGDGTSLWTLTHHKDFAVGFNGLFGNPESIGEHFHITSDEWLSWNQIFELTAESFGAELNAVHIPSEYINSLDPGFGAGLLGDKAHSMIFDNSKIRSVVPAFHPKIKFTEGIRDVVEYYNQHPEMKVVDHERDASIVNILKHWKG